MSVIHCFCCSASWGHINGSPVTGHKLARQEAQGAEWLAVHWQIYGIREDSGYDTKGKDECPWQWKKEQLMDLKLHLMLVQQAMDIMS